jgi:hypothetical protein
MIPVAVYQMCHRGYRVNKRHGNAQLAVMPAGGRNLWVPSAETSIS